MLVSLNANAWRMLRRMRHTHPKARTFREIRDWTRHTLDIGLLDRMADDGLVIVGKETADCRDRTYRLTKAGVAASDLGEYEKEFVPAGASGR